MVILVVEEPKGESPTGSRVEIGITIAQFIAKLTVPSSFRKIVGNNFSHSVKRNIIDAKSPYEILDRCDVLLVRLGRQEGLGQPLSLVDLLHMSQLYQLCNCLLNYWRLKWPKGRVPTADRSCIPCVDLALVVFYRGGHTLLAKDSPILLNYGSELALFVRGEVRNV